MTARAPGERLRERVRDAKKWCESACETTPETMRERVRDDARAREASSPYPYRALASLGGSASPGLFRPSPSSWPRNTSGNDCRFATAPGARRALVLHLGRVASIHDLHDRFSRVLKFAQRVAVPQAARPSALCRSRLLAPPGHGQTGSREHSPLCTSSPPRLAAAPLCGI